MYLSVIIPAYNEEERLPKTLREVDKYLRTKDYESEIIVVSDGSTDKTVEVVENLITEIKNLRLVEFEKKRGKGFGVRQGMLKASGQYRVFTDADNSTSIDQVEKMWPYFDQGYDIVIGSRDIKGAVIAVPQTWFRRRLGDIFNLISQIISGLWGIWDTQCGFKGFTKKAASDIFPRTVIDRFAFDVEVLILAKKLGYKFKEIPIVWMNDPESKVKFKSMVEMLIDVFKIKLNFIKNIYGI